MKLQKKNTVIKTNVEEMFKQISKGEETFIHIIMKADAQLPATDKLKQVAFFSATEDRLVWPARPIGPAGDGRQAGQKIRWEFPSPLNGKNDMHKCSPGKLLSIFSKVKYC